MNDKLNALAFSMLVLGVLGNLGLYTGAVTMMSQWHLFFTLPPQSILMGMVEAAAITFIFTYLFSLIYNKIS